MGWVNGWKGTCEGLWGTGHILFLDLDPGDMGVFSLWKFSWSPVCTRDICFNKAFFNRRSFVFLKCVMNDEKWERYYVLIQKVLLFLPVLSYNDHMHCINNCCQSWSDVTVNNYCFSASCMSLKDFVKVSFSLRVDGYTLVLKRKKKLRKSPSTLYAM